MHLRHSFNDADLKLPSELSFGLLFSVIFASAGAYVLYKSSPPVLAAAFFVAAAIFLTITVLSPVRLRPLNRAWLKFGIFIGKIVSPIVLGVIFFFVITPYAVVMRLAGRDALKLHKQNVNSYWVDRKPTALDPQSFKNQF